MIWKDFGQRRSGPLEIGKFPVGRYPQWACKASLGKNRKRVEKMGKRRRKREKKENKRRERKDEKLHLLRAIKSELQKYVGRTNFR